MNDERTAEEIAELFSAPFPAADIRWKPGAVRDNRAMALAYLTSRAVMSRLDHTVGIGGWKDSYRQLEGSTIECSLSVKIEGEWITKVDVGGESEQPDEGDKVKAAYSDALKRAGVKFGIGRFLYELPTQWVEYDAQKRRFVGTPTLPSFVLPGKEPDPAPKRLTADQEKEVRAFAEELEREATTVDTLNAAMRQMHERALPRGKFKEALWGVMKEHANQQGWAFKPKLVKFVNEPSRETAEAR